MKELNYFNDLCDRLKQAKKEFNKTPTIKSYNHLLEVLDEYEIAVLFKKIHNYHILKN